jgi:bifunctional non-homologous end joining protein LigD
MPNPISQSLRPMLAVPAAEPFDSEHHVFDVRWDGVRALAFIERARLRLVSQAGRDITAWFPELAPLAGQVRLEGTVLDGEIVALGATGEPDLALLGSRLSCGRMEGDLSLVYQAFDLLAKGGRTVVDQPLVRRRAELKGVLKASGPGLASDWVETDGIACFEAVADRRLPGIVAKEKASLYLPGQRSEAWREVRVYESGWFVVGGYVIGLGKEGPVAGLLLGEPDERGRLDYAGAVQAGFPAGDFEAVLSAVSSPACPFVSAPAVTRLVYWQRPDLVAEVRHGGRDAEGRLRFPVFVTLRPDLGPADCMAVKENAARKRTGDV